MFGVCCIFQRRNARLKAKGSDTIVDWELNKRFGREKRRNLNPAFSIWRQS